MASFSRLIYFAQQPFFNVILPYFWTKTSFSKFELHYKSTLSSTTNIETVGKLPRENEAIFGTNAILNGSFYRASKKPCLEYYSELDLCFRWVDDSFIWYASQCPWDISSQLLLIWIWKLSSFSQLVLLQVFTNWIDMISCTYDLAVNCKSLL